ncbi:MAG: amidohydrolase family protein [candidate division Zixibacteria bacterium]|nr:amidohydrolase family protein [candidate division Zixibacteria bacterium]
MRHIRHLLMLVVLLVSTGAAHDYIPGAKQSAPILLKGGTLYTVSGGVLPNTDLLFDNGRITQIAPTITPPNGAEVIDVTGQYVYPGMINGQTQIGLVEVGSVRGSNDNNEIGRNNADLRAWVAYNPDSEIIPTVRSNGVLTCLVVPGGALLQGRSSLMNLDGWTREDAAEKPVVALHMTWPAVAIVDAWWMEKSAEEQKKDMDENRAAIGRLFEDARAYWLAKQADPRIKIDSRWEAMLPIFTRELPVIIYADDYRQIDEAVAFSKKHGFRMILSGGKEAWKASELLKLNDIPVVVAPTTSLPMRHDDDYDLAYRIPGLIAKAGLKFCFGTFDSWSARNLPFQAGNACAYGLDKETALRAITLSPAEIFGVEKDLGSLDVGKKATLIVSKGDILDPLTHGVTLAFIEGRKVDLDNKHKELYRKYDAKHTEIPGK